jgi:bla regulator protein blaR1
MMTLIANHLLQSTIVVALVGLLTLAFRDNRAQVRHWLWVAASVKFLMPFAVLIAGGRALGWRLLPAVPARQLTIVMQFVGEPVSRTVSQASTRSAAFVESGPASNIMTMAPLVLLVLWMIGSTVLLIAWLARWRRVSHGVRGAAVLEDGRELAILRRLEHEHGARRPIPLVLADSRMEPGVFGILRPRLVWPRGISQRLDDRQIEAVMAHELSHVRRCDNLIALVHMVVQALFWFHPLVWWLGARLVEERERACDEAVLRCGSEPGVYAESILKTCRFFVESPLTCVAGVTGADLKHRIEAIMTRRDADPLSTGKRCFLAAVGVSAIVGPLAVGVLGAPRLRAQTVASISGAAQRQIVEQAAKGLEVAANAARRTTANGLRDGDTQATQTAANPTFEVASVKPNKSGEGPSRIGLQPGGRVTVINMSVRSLIRFAYQFQDFQILGGPDWIGGDRFDIAAKAENDIPPSAPGTIGAGQLMMRSLLSDRFKLTLHPEKRELPIYELKLVRNDGRLGPQLKLSTTDCQAMMNAARERGAPPPPQSPGQRPVCGMRAGPGQMTAGAFPLSQLAFALSQMTQRVVVDRTGLAGDFDLDLTFTPDQTNALGTPKPDVSPPPIDPNGPSIFTALQEQLGLKLESTRGPVDVLVIDHAELPSPD